MPPRKNLDPDSAHIRLMSAKKISEYLGVHRDSVANWIAAGCPTEAAPLNSGEAYTMDIKKVVDWLLKRERENATNLALDQVRRATKSSKAGGGKSPGKEAWDTVRSQAQAGIAVVEEAERRLAVAPIDLMDDMVKARDEKLATALREIENKVEADLPPGFERGVAGTLVRNHINAALKLVGKTTLRSELGPMRPYDELPDMDTPDPEMVDTVMGDDDAE